MDFKLKAYVCKNKSNNFYVCLSWYEQGEHKRKNVTLPSSITSRSEARLASVNILNKFQKELDKHSDDNVFNLIASYKENITDVRENTRYKYENILNKFIEFLVKYAEMQGLDAIFTVDENLLNLYISFLSPSHQVDTIRNNINYIARVIKDLGLPAIELSKLNYKQCNKKQEKVKKKFISKNELDNICKHFDTNVIYKPMQLIVDMSIWFGLRREEVLGLLWSDIDFDTNEMHIKHTRVKYGSKSVRVDDTKTIASKRVYSINKIRDYLLDIKQQQVDKGVWSPDGNVCLNSKNKPCDVDYTTKLFKRAVRELGLDDSLTFKDLRSTCATRLLDMGLSDSQIISYMGHTDIKTTRAHYFQYNAELKEKITDKLIDFS